MQDQKARSLREHLDDLLKMKGAHIGIAEAVAGFPVELRGAKPAGAPHSAWELLEHMRLAQEDILDFSRDSGYQERAFPDDYWPATASPPDDLAWDQAVGQFERGLREMQAVVDEHADNLLARIPHGQGQTFLREALLVADHNAYHLGQLVFLRKMLEAGSAR